MSHTQHFPIQQTATLAKSFWSLRRRLLVMISIVVLATLLLIAAGVFYFISQNEDRSWQERQQEATGYAAEIMAQFIQRNLDTLFLLSVVTPDQLAAQPELANELLQQNSDLLEIIRLDQDSVIFANGYQDTSLLTGLFTLKQSVWYTESKAGRVHVSDVQVSSDSVPYLVMSIPTPDGGVVAARLQLNVLETVVTDLRFGQTGRAYVLNSDGLIMAHAEPNVILAATTLAGRPEFEAVQNAPGMVWNGSYRNFQGNDVIGVTAPIAGLDWIMVTEIFRAETTENSRSAHVFIMVGLLLFGGPMFVMMSRYLERLILRPVHQLAEGVSRIGLGDLNHRIKVDRQDELGQVSEAFNQMTAALQASYDNLEDRVKQRTQRLEVAASLSEQLTATLILSDLLDQLVTQIQDRFGYYHAQVYLVDEIQEMLVMEAGTGQAGVEMRAQGHQIPINAPASLVAQAARRGEIVQVDNVREAVNWLPNPLLPDTHSEMAVPIILQGQVVGVLDVQQATIAGLDEGDADLLRTLANQVAAGIRNAQQFEQVQNALREAQAVQAQYVEQVWGKNRLSHFTTAQTEVTLINAMAGPETISQLPPALIVPIELRQQLIGHLELDDANPERVWSQDELDLVEAVLEQLGQSAENLRLFESTREQASREQTIRQITEKLRAAPNLQSLVKIASEVLGEQLGAKYTNLELGFENKEKVN